MRDRSEAMTNLLLASAPLLRLAEANKRAPWFAAAWRAAQRGDEAAAPKVSMEAAKGLLRTALGLCEATRIDGVELTTLYNDRRDHGEFAMPADLETLLDAAAGELLAMMAMTNPTNKEVAA